mgnify:CR=1 FL=1
MNFNKLILIFFSFISLYSCAEYSVKNTQKNQEKQYYSSSGFALIYDDNLFYQKVVNKKINNDELKTMHAQLKRNTNIKIINPLNSKFIETKISKKANFPQIFNIVISNEIASLLDLDPSNPFVEVLEIKKNKTFIAKKAKTFDEEKNVAEKVTVNEVVMDDITKEKSNTKKKVEKKYNFILVISDFYFEDSANNLKNDIINQTQIRNLSVKKINDKKYRLFVGPFKNFKALKASYISLNNLGFDDLNVYKE